MGMEGLIASNIEAARPGRNFLMLEKIQDPNELLLSKLTAGAKQHIFNTHLFLSGFNYFI